MIFPKILLGLTAGSLLFSTHKGAHLTGTPCRAADAQSDDMVSLYQYIATSSDADNTAWRTTAGLSAVSLSQVVLLNDTTLCRRAVNAYNAAMPSAQSTEVFLVKYGTTRYVMQDPAHNAGEYELHLITDSAFVKVSGPYLR